LHKKISLVLFIVVIVVFLLPWITISCAGSNVVAVTFSGLDLVTGKELSPSLGQSTAPTSQQPPSSFGGLSVTGTRLDTNLLVVAALALAIAGVIVSLLRKDSSGVRIVLGLLGIAVLIFFKYQVDNQVSRATYRIVQVSYLPGYWLAIAAFGSAAVVSFLKPGNNSS
jgi:hypothetical protein